MTKQEVLNYLDNVLHPIVSPNNWNIYSELYDMIEELPPAEPVRHGKWIPSPTLDSRGFTAMFKCSECKRYSYYAYPVERLDYKYCPHCGARMAEE